MKKITAALIIIVLIGIFYKYGRSIYIPIFNKLRGTETVDSISNKIEPNVFHTGIRFLEQNEKIREVVTDMLKFYLKTKGG